MSDLYKTLLISRPQVLSSGGSGLLVAANNLSDVADVTTARTNLGAASALTVSNLPSTLASRGYIYSDGATSNRAQIQLPGTRGNLAGAPVASWVGWVDVPSSSSTGEIASVSSSTTALASATAWSLGIAFATNDLVIRANGATVATDFRTLTISAFRTTYSGQRIWLEVRFSNGSTAPVVRVNGSSVSGTSADGAGTDPDWLSSSLVSTNHVTGYAFPAGPAPLGQWLNAHLTDTESETWRTTGRPPVWVAVGGSCASVYTSSFAAGADSFTAGTGCTIDGNIDSINGQDDWLRAQRTSTTGSVFIVRNMATLFAPSALRAGGVITLRARVYNASATARYVSFGGGGYVSDSSGSTPALVPATSQADIVVTRRLRSDEHTFLSDWRIYLTTSSSGVDSTVPTGDLFYFKNIEFVFNGALSLAAVQPIPVLDDVTGIEGNQARLLGMTPVTERKDWRIVDSTAISGNEPILGGATFLEANRHRIDSWVINNRGTSRTVYLGNQSNGTEYATSFTAGAGLTEVTLATRFNATVNLWCNSNGTDQLVHTITGHRLGSS